MGCSTFFVSRVLVLFKNSMTLRSNFFLTSCVALVFVGFFQPRTIEAQFLEQELKQNSLKELDELAEINGDAARGAVVFFQPSMACSKCHSVGDGIQTNLGPNLASTKEPLTNEEIVEAVLDPSKTIRKGFASASVLTADGETFSGLLVLAAHELAHDAVDQAIFQ